MNFTGFSLHRQLVESSHSLFSLQILGLEHKNSLDCHTVPQQIIANLSVCSLHYVNHLARQFELFIHVFGHCWYHIWRQVFLSIKAFCSNDQQIPQSHEQGELCFSHCEIWYQSDIFVAIFRENFEFYIQVIGLLLRPKKDQICLGICQSPHSQHKLACPRKQ